LAAACATKLAIDSELWSEINYEWLGLMLGIAFVQWQGWYLGKRIDHLENELRRR
jgi:hypothetical protein